jgi:hypothetical protein
MSRSSLIALATFSSVAISATISIIWFVTTSGASRFEPAVQALGLLAGLTGVLAERRAAARERRHLALVALGDELRRGVSILDDPSFAPSKGIPKPRVYPRLPTSATDAALISGALAEQSDDDLLRLLHNWRGEVNGFNRRLELTEIRLFTSGIPTEIAEFERALHRNNGYLDQIRRDLQDLQNFLATRYRITLGRAAESGKNASHGPVKPVEFADCDDDKTDNGFPRGSTLTSGEYPPVVEVRDAAFDGCQPPVRTTM